VKSVAVVATLHDDPLGLSPSTSHSAVVAAARVCVCVCFEPDRAPVGYDALRVQLMSRTTE